MVKSFLCGWMLGLAAAAAMAAGAVEAEDGRAVRVVIEAQLEALAADDAETAYAHATPGIRAQFRNAAAFLAMVRRAYPMLIRPASTGFLVPEWNAGAIMQGVQFRDREGHYWRALYELQRINGRYALVTMCIGGGQGIAAIIERT